MNIYINDIDITNRLIEDNDIIINLEREIEAFNRTVGDVTIVASNIDNYFNSIFNDIYTAKKYIVKIYEDNNLLFKGFIHLPSIEFNTVNRIVTFTVFSFEKYFWDRCKERKIRRDYSFNEMFVWITLERLINKQIREGFGDIIKPYVVIDEELANKKIRMYADTLDIEITNYGKYKDLEEDTTIYKLFNALSINFNAEFFIDITNDELHFIRRKMHSGNEIQIDDKIMDDKILIYPVDDEKFDWIKLSFKAPKCNYPLPSNYTIQGAYSGLAIAINYYYITTLTINGVESGRSDILNVKVLQPIRLPSGEYTAYYYPKFQIPDIPVNAKLSIYRKNDWTNRYPLLNVFRRVAEIYNGNILWQDTLSDEDINNNINNYPQFREAKDNIVYLGYDDEIGSWRPLLYSGVDEEPIGKIFNAVPELKFTTDEEGINSLFYFFGMENNINFIQDLWYNILNVRKKIECEIKELNVNIDDVVKINNRVILQDYGNIQNFKVRKVEKNLMKKTSTIIGVEL